MLGTEEELNEWISRAKAAPPTFGVYTSNGEAKMMFADKDLDQRILLGIRVVK